MLEIRDLHVQFHGSDHEAVRGIDLTVGDGEIVGLVGESGSGKSVTAYSIMQILADTGRITSGHILYKGQDLTTWDARQMSGFRAASRAGTSVWCFRSP